MIKRITRDEATVFQLPGRDWLYYFGPDIVPTEHVTVGLAVFPPGSRPTGHVHDSQEETIFVTRGRGRLVTPDGTADLEAGVSVFIAMGTFHATESDGPDPLELVCLFSPPVVPGSYERGSAMTRTEVAVALDAAEVARLEKMARSIRVAIVRTVHTVKVGHVGGPLSAADILAALYGRVLRIRPDRPDWPDSRPFHPVERPLLARSVRRDGVARIPPAR